MHSSRGRLLTIILLVPMLGACSKDTEPTKPDTPLSYSLVGDWEWVRSGDGPFVPNEVYTYIREGGSFCSIESNQDGSYGDNGVGAWTVGSNSTVTFNYRGDPEAWVCKYSFRSNGDTLDLAIPAWNDTLICARVSDAPSPEQYLDTYYVWGGNNRWPQDTIENDSEYYYLGSNRTTQIFNTAGYDYIVMKVYSGDQIKLDAVKLGTGYLGTSVPMMTVNFHERSNIYGPPDQLHSVLAGGVFGMQVAADTYTPYIISP